MTSTIKLKPRPGTVPEVDAMSKGIADAIIGALSKAFGDMVEKHNLAVGALVDDLRHRLISDMATRLRHLAVDEDEIVKLAESMRNDLARFHKALADA